ncbi:MAG: VOC family protein [Proteobacteria bacterium]|nr:VOC family protein [Pseudomonadota bacterium]
MIPCTIDHFHLRSADPVQAAQFYIDNFGAWEMRRLMNGDKLRLVLSLGGLTLFIEQVAEGTHFPPKAPFMGYEHLGLTVRDVTAAVAELRIKGVRIEQDVTELSPTLHIAFIEGPDRVRIELLQRG